MTIIGIDLGTSNCCISFINDSGIIELIIDPEYPELFTIPSIISIDPNGILVGNEINQLHINSNKNIFHNFKRLIGHCITDIETTNLIQILNYSIIEENNQIICLDNNSKKYHLEEIIYFLLNKIKSIINKKFGSKEWSCIITIPAYFNEMQRQITWNAILLCQLPCIKLLNEPTAASFTYLYHNQILSQISFDKKILIIDFGAGTLDLTILDINKTDEIVCEVLGIYGDNNFGGIDITRIIYDQLFDNDLNDINIKLKIADDIKILLSNQIDVKYYSNILDKTFTYNYQDFCNQLKDLSEKMLVVIKNILTISKLNKSNIDEVILVGGSFKIPLFRTLISEFFCKPIDRVLYKINNKEYSLYEDIAVSVGAAIYGYYNSTCRDIILIERLPLSIGIDTTNGEIVKIIERNTIIPITKTKIFTTENNTQESVEINIYQGESIFKDNCCFIGKFILSNLPPNKPVILVSIKIDTNGMINVIAKDKRNITESSIQVKCHSSNLSIEQIDELIIKYEGCKKDEKIYKTLINHYYDLVNIIDKISYQINFNFILTVEQDIKTVIREDLGKILETLNNKFIIDKFKINTNLLQKCAIINDLSFNLINSDISLNDDDIEQFITMLELIKNYLTDKYDIFIIQKIDNIKSMDINDKFDLLEDLEDLEDLEELVDDYTDIKNLNNNIIIVEDSELIKLFNYLINNIDEFNLTDDGNKYLISQLNQIMDNKSLISESDKINAINNICISVQHNYSKS